MFVGIVFCSILFLTTLYTSIKLRRTLKAQNNLLFGIKLPSSVRQHKLITKLQEEFLAEVSQTKYLYLFLSVFLFLFLKSHYFFLTYTYFLLCFLFIIIHPNFILRKYLVKCSVLKYTITSNSDNTSIDFNPTLDLFVCEPRNSSLFVKNKYNSNYTLNLASFKGKFTLIAILIILLSSLLLSVVYSLGEKNTEHKLHLIEDTVIIKSFYYKDTFELNEIINMTLIKDYPSHINFSGLSLEDYTKGYYIVDDYGLSKFYIHKAIPRFIVIELDPYFIFYNEPSIEETYKLYTKLLNEKRGQPPK